MALDNEIMDSMRRYFRVLMKTGYYPDIDTMRLVALCGIGRVLDRFNAYVSEKDYKDIQHAISALRGSTCLIPYKVWVDAVSRHKGGIPENDIGGRSWVYAGDGNGIEMSRAEPFDGMTWAGEHSRPGHIGEGYGYDI